MKLPPVVLFITPAPYCHHVVSYIFSYNKYSSLPFTLVSINAVTFFNVYVGFSWINVSFSLELRVFASNPKKNMNKLYWPLRTPYTLQLSTVVYWYSKINRYGYINIVIDVQWSVRIRKQTFYCQKPSLNTQSWILGRLGSQASTEYFCNFAKVCYFGWWIFFHIFICKKKKKLYIYIFLPCGFCFKKFNESEKTINVKA